MHPQSKTASEGGEGDFMKMKAAAAEAGAA